MVDHTKVVIFLLLTLYTVYSWAQQELRGFEDYGNNERMQRLKYVMAAEKDAEFEANRKAVRSIENRSELVILNAPEDAFAAHTASTHEQRRIRNRSDTHKENSSATPTQVYDQTAYYQSPELVNMSSTIDVKTNRASKEKKADGGSKSVGGGGGGGSSGGRNAYGCFWHGIAPFCKESCPLEFDFIRSHSGHCTFQEFFSGKMNCIPDDNFGKACWNFGKKHLCCKGKTAGCTWNGVWTSSLKAYNIHCKHHPGGECGEVRCFISNHWYKDYDENVVEGEHCNKVQLFDFEGSMTCGFVAWTDEHGNHADAWYKIR